MNSERWQHVADIFDAVLDRAPEQREKALEEFCADDSELRQAVKSLLDAEHEAEAFMEEPLVPSPGEAVASAEALAGKGRRIGPYRLLRRSGQGGMSTVFLAVRDDDFRRRVAIKIIRKGMESEDALHRLRTERQILASLHHPFIAELYDGGTTGEGLPFFAMEYVDGRPIDEYCNDAQLTVQERIMLLRNVCEAVQYAHQNLVVHRDIKPSNILVKSDGVPKLLDFGIAKLLNPELSASDLEPTATWMRPMTPHYASPEQIRGEMITTSSDIYSLGALLYKLLTGQMPHQLEGRTPREIEHELTSVEPLKPSTAVGRKAAGSRFRKISGAEGESRTDTKPWSVAPKQLRRELEGDLDMIVLKCLRVSPQRRYSSVEAFSKDLERYLTGFPVKARQGNVRYRIGKFFRRNWAPASVGILIFGLLIAFGITMVFQSAAIARERDQARLERDEKEQVLALVQDVFKLADPSQARGESYTVREALERSAGRIGQRLRSQPAVEAALRHTIGVIYLNLGLLSEAEPHITEALEIRRGLYSEANLEKSQSLTTMGALLREKGKYEKAQSLFDQAIAMTHQLFGEDDPHLIDPLNELLVLLCYRGQYEAAEEPSRKVLELARKYPDPTRSKLAQAVTNRAVVLRQKGDVVGAEEMYREALKLQRAVSGSDHPVVADILNNLGVISRVLGNTKEAEQFHSDTLALRRHLYGDNHVAVAQSFANLASVWRDQGKFSQSEDAFQQALAIVKPSLGDTHPVAVLVTIALSSLLLDEGRIQEAESLLRDNLAKWRSILGERHALIGWAENVLGGALAALGRFEEAEELLLRGFSVLEKNHGSKHERTRKAAERIVLLYEAWGNLEKAAQYRSFLSTP